MTKAQAVYERVEALVASGSTKADAFKRIAEETDQKVNSVRGAYYQHTKKLGGTARSRTKRETTPTDAVEGAKALLQRSIDSIDDEIEAAKERAEEAKAEYENLRKSAGDRKTAIAAKIDALEKA